MLGSRAPFNFRVNGGSAFPLSWVEPFPYPNGALTGNGNWLQGGSPLQYLQVSSSRVLGGATFTAQDAIAGNTLGIDYAAPWRFRISLFVPTPTTLQSDEGITLEEGDPQSIAITLAYGSIETGANQVNLTLQDTTGTILVGNFAITYNTINTVELQSTAGVVTVLVNGAVAGTVPYTAPLGNTGKVGLNFSQAGTTPCGRFTELRLDYAT